MSRLFGTISRGVRAPIIKNGDDIVAKINGKTITGGSAGNGGTGTELAGGGGAGAGYYFSDVLIQCWEWVWSSQSVVIECTAEEGIEDGTEEVIVEIIEEPEIEIQPIEVEKETALANTLATLPREYVNFIATEEVGKNSRLAWIAYKYYEEKDLWVFIYEANRDVLSHPSRVRPGQKLRIPALDKRYRDLSNPELQQLVDSLAVEYLK